MFFPCRVAESTCPTATITSAGDKATDERCPRGNRTPVKSPSTFLKLWCAAIYRRFPAEHPEIAKMLRSDKKAAINRRTPKGGRTLNGRDNQSICDFRGRSRVRTQCCSRKIVLSPFSPPVGVAAVKIGNGANRTAAIAFPLCRKQEYCSPGTVLWASPCWTPEITVLESLGVANQGPRERCIR